MDGRFERPDDGKKIVKAVVHQCLQTGNTLLNQLPPDVGDLSPEGKAIVDVRRNIKDLEAITSGLLLVYMKERRSGDPFIEESFHTFWQTLTTLMSQLKELADTYPELKNDFYSFVSELGVLGVLMSGRIIPELQGLAPTVAIGFFKEHLQEEVYTPEHKEKTEHKVLDVELFGIALWQHIIAFESHYYELQTLLEHPEESDTNRRGALLQMVRDEAAQVALFADTHAEEHLANLRDTRFDTLSPEECVRQMQFYRQRYHDTISSIANRAKSIGL